MHKGQKKKSKKLFVIDFQYVCTFSVHMYNFMLIIHNIVIC